MVVNKHLTNIVREKVFDGLNERNIQTRMEEVE